MRQRGKKLGLASMVVAGVMSFLPMGCGGGSDDGTTIPEPEPNNAPYSSVTPKDNTDEKVLYQQDLNPQDDEGDTVTCTANTIPAGASVTPDGVVSWSPTNGQSDQDHFFSVKLDDGTDSTDVEWLVYVNGTGAPSFNIESAGPREKLQNIEVTLEARSSSDVYTATTDANGVAQFLEIPDQEYDVTVKDLGGTHTTHKPGKFVLSGPKETENNLESTLRLSKKTDQDFLNEVLRFNGQIHKPAQQYTFRFFTYNPTTGTKESQPLIDDVRTRIKSGNISRFFQTTITDADIIEMDSLPPIIGAPDFQPPNGVIYIFYNDSIPTWGGNVNYFDAGGNILSGKAFFKTNAPTGTIDQEVVEAGKAESESNLGLSMFNDPLTGDTFYPLDEVASDIYNNRPTGNIDIGSEDNHDVNPFDYVINQ